MTSLEPQITNRAVAPVVAALDALGLETTALLQPLGLTREALADDRCSVAEAGYPLGLGEIRFSRAFSPDAPTPIPKGAKGGRS